MLLRLALQHAELFRLPRLREFEPLELDPVAADLGKVVVGLLHKPSVFGTAENLR